MASDRCSYLEEYAEYFRSFQVFVSKLKYEDDLLPSNLKCRSGQEELIGECLEWTLRYLRLTQCPQSLLPFIAKSALDRVKLRIDEYTQEGVLAPNMVEIVNEICLQFCGQDNPALLTLPVPSSVPLPVISTCAIRNTRRRMENRQSFVADLDVIFNISTSHPTHYYGVFDGHSGVDAAAYCSTHLHCFIAQSPSYPSDPVRALKDAFAKTESLFAEKCNQENINGGCTALCILHRPVDRQLYAAWVGDSQAIVVGQNKILRLVNPHKPDRVDERQRIEQAGGVVLFYGTWRVNGQLAVSRAIGDVSHKKFVSGVPDITSLTLSGEEDFLVIGCDGLWDSVKEVEVAATVYDQLQNDTGDPGDLSKSLVSLARTAGSEDNISVLVVLLRPAGLIAPPPANEEPELLAAYPPSRQGPQGRQGPAPMDILDAADSASNPFLPANGLRDGGPLGAFDDSPSSEEPPSSSGPQTRAEDEDDDLGPETDVDAVDEDEVDDVLVSPTTQHNPFLLQKTSLDKHEVLALAMGDSDDQPTSLEPLEALSSSQLAKAGEVDNVGESGEESEDEWNYYRVEPTGDKDPGPQNPDSGAIDDMESQLNPNAAVFIPSSPTENSNHIEQPFNEDLTQEEFFNKDDVMSSSFIAHDPVPAGVDSSPLAVVNGKDDEVWLSSSPKKGGVPLDNVNVPAEEEFDKEVSQRPGDLDVENQTSTMNGEGLVIETFQNGQRSAEDRDLFDESPVQNVLDICEPFAVPLPAKPNMDIVSDDDASPREAQLDVLDKLAEVSAEPSLKSGEEECFDDVKATTVVEPFFVVEAPSPSETAPNLVEKAEFLEDDSSNVGQFIGDHEQLKQLNYSPIVSGASDLAQEYSGLGAPSGQSTIDTLTETLNDGVLYSTSAFDKVMNALPTTMNTLSSSMDQCAQSTPLEGNPFKFDTEEDKAQESNSDFILPKPEEPNAFLLQTEVQVHSQFDPESSVLFEVNVNDKNDLKQSIAEDSQIAKEELEIQEEVETICPPFDLRKQLISLDEPFGVPVIKSGQPGLSDDFELFGMSPVPETSKGGQSPLPEEIPSVAYQDNVSDPPAELLENIDPPAPMPEIIPDMLSGNENFAFGFQNQEPVVQGLNEMVHAEESGSLNDNVNLLDEQPSQFIANGFEREEHPDVNGFPAFAPDNFIEKELIEPRDEVIVSTSAQQVAAEVPPSDTEVELQDPIVAPPSPAGVSAPEVETLNQAAAEVEVAAAAGAGAAVAAVAVAAAVAASKTDKKPAGKAPAAKAKPSATAKAPVKTTTTTTTTKATSAPAPSAAAKRPAPVPPVPAARAAPRTAVAPAKPATATRTASSAVASAPKPASPAPPKPRAAAITAASKSATADKKPLTNGEAKPAAARPAARAAPSATAQRPATAPATAKASAPAAPKAAPRPAPIRKVPAASAVAAAKPKTTSAVADSKAKPAAPSTVAAKARPASARPAPTAKAAPATKPIDKQTKETANKLISATRTTVSRAATAAKTAASKTTVSATSTAAAPAKSTMSKPAPIRKPASSTGATGATKVANGKKPNEKPKVPMTNGNVKNGHATPEEMPVQNGISHEPVIEKRENDLKIEALVDNQLVA